MPNLSKAPFMYPYESPLNKNFQIKLYKKALPYAVIYVILKGANCYRGQKSTKFFLSIDI